MVILIIFINYNINIFIFFLIKKFIISDKYKFILVPFPKKVPKLKKNSKYVKKKLKKK